MGTLLGGQTSQLSRFGRETRFSLQSRFHDLPTMPEASPKLATNPTKARGYVGWEGLLRRVGTLAD